MDKFIDSHAHLDFANYNTDFIDLIERTKNEVELVINPASDKESNTKIIQLVDRYAFIYGALGLHPHDSRELDDTLLKMIEKNCAHKKIIAIGEIGLDYFKNYAPPDVQKKTFSQLLEIALLKNKPVIIHCRDAMHDTLKILDQFHMRHVVFHCFTGNMAEAEEILKRGFYISLSGVITFGKNKKLEEAIEKTPLEFLFVETDAPFLSPHPYRGKRNEPIYVKYVAQKLAEIKKISIDDVIRITKQNVKNFFTIN